MFSELLEESVTKDDIEAVVKAKNLYGSCMNTSTSYPLHWWEWKKLKKMSNWNRCTKIICWLSQLTIFTRVKFTNLRRVHTYICYRRFTSFFFQLIAQIEGDDISVALPLLKEVGGWPILGKNEGGNWNEENFSLASLIASINKYSNVPFIYPYVFVDSKNKRQKVLYVSILTWEWLFTALLFHPEYFIKSWI